jgi:MYXO-CTERM domain-containing protein
LKEAVMNTFTRTAAAAALVLATATSAFAAPTNLGVVTSTGTSFSNTISGTGAFTDYYTFSLAPSSGGATGGVYDSQASFAYEGVDVQSLTLSVVGGSAVAPVDTTPDGFTFSGLTSGVTYQLAVSGTGVPVIGLNLNGTYQGNIKAVASVASPAPEAADLALTALGLGGVAFWARRRRAV